MKFGVVVFPGSNCDDDTVGVIQSLGHEAVKLWHKDTDLQNLMSPEYLTIHAAAQRVLQKLGPWSDLEILSATEAGNGPLHYLSKTDWDSTKAVNSLCEQEEHRTTIIKFRGSDREVAEKNISSLNCVFGIS